MKQPFFASILCVFASLREIKIIPLIDEGSIFTVKGNLSAAKEEVKGTTINIGEDSTSVCTAIAGRFPVSSRLSEEGKLTKITSPLGIYYSSIANIDSRKLGKLKPEIINQLESIVLFTLGYQVI
jgi:hypothetical protein